MIGLILKNWITLNYDNTLTLVKQSSKFEIYMSLRKLAPTKILHNLPVSYFVSEMCLIYK